MTRLSSSVCLRVWTILDAELGEIQLRDVRRELQDVTHQRDAADAKAARVEDLEESATELRRQNRELEDQV